MQSYLHLDKEQVFKRQSYFSQISRERDEAVEIIKVDNNKGVKVDD